MVIQLMYKYRLYPSNKHKVKLVISLKTCKAIYNELLALNIDSWIFGKVSLSGFDCNQYLAGKYDDIHSQTKQNVSDRVHKAFQNFFRRVKSNSKQKGFPRFKSRVNSITFPQSGFKLLSDRKIKLSKIGSIPIILHRIPKGKIKTLTIKQNKCGQWFAVFACELPNVKKPFDETFSKSFVGIDVGLENFATLSNGELVANPRYLVKSEKKLKLLSRRMGRKVKGSANRRKARFRLARQHNKITNQRMDFLHKLSHRLTKSYSFIAVEQLNIKGMMNDCFWAKQIGDAGWGTFISFLKYKAVIGGGSCVENSNTRGSSHRCSKCGAWNEITLSERTFHCCSCGFSVHRDFNASNNHLNDTAGLVGILTPVETKPLPPNGKACSVIEAGTINDTV